MPPAVRRAGACAAPRGSSCRVDTRLKLGRARLRIDALEALVVARHGEQMVDEGGLCRFFERAQASVVFRSDHDDGGGAAPGHQLRLATPGGLDHGAEPVLGVLEGPAALYGAFLSSH